MAYITSRFLRLTPLAVLLLTACQLPDRRGQRVDSPAWQAHVQKTMQISRYQTRGSFIWIDGPQRVYARYFWQQSAPDTYHLRLLNPLGKTDVDLVAAPGQAVLTDSKGKRYRSTDPEALLQKLTGMAIPLNNLRQWMLGLPGDATQITLDSDALLKTLDYARGGQQWHVTYHGYDTRVSPALPKNMELSQGDKRIKLKMDDWKLL